MAIAEQAGVRTPRDAVQPRQRTIRIGRRQVPVVGPSIRDPRIHLSITILAIITIGMLWLDFRLSVPQVTVTMLSCFVLEVVYTFVRTGSLVWPASALQTATSTALLLRVTGMEAGDWWAFDGWYYFVGVASAGVLTKYLLRFRGRHIFNPSNVALVVAFIVFGSERIEPLDYWWAPLGWAMVAAYVVILAGGNFICGRLKLIEMGLAFYATFAVGVGVLAVLGQSITTRWSLTPISGTHFWWILVTSPETLIFLYFMITDPKTTPAGRVPRILFGCAVGVTSCVLLAPWQTEFGTKVGFLGGLTVVTAVAPFLEHWLAARAARRADAALDVSRPWRLAGAPQWMPGAAALAATVVFVTVVAVAGIPNRSTASSEPAPPPVSFDIDPASLPTVTIDDDVAALSAELATPAGAQELAAALAFNLQVEAEAIITGDASLLPAVTDGQRLNDMRAVVEQAAGGSEVVVPSYRFDTLHLSIVYPGGLQRGANAGLTATGTVTHVTYSAGGEQIATSSEPIHVMFSLRETTSGRWLTTDTPPIEAAE